jgi:hypothetical protein
VHGRFWYTVQPDGTRTSPISNADVENLGETLA